jgi:hypothetical protein
MSEILPYKQELDASIALLEKNKQEALAINDPKAFIKNQVRKNAALWWRTWEEDMNHEDFAVRRNAQIEYNKLQCRVLPTELTSPEDGGVIVKLAQYKQVAEQDLSANEATAQSASFIDVTSDVEDENFDI